MPPRPSLSPGKRSQAAGWLRQKIPCSQGRRVGLDAESELATERHCDYSLLMTSLWSEFTCVGVSDRFGLFERKVKLKSAPAALPPLDTGLACRPFKGPGSARRRPWRQAFPLGEQSPPAGEDPGPRTPAPLQGPASHPRSRLPARERSACRVSEQGTEARIERPKQFKQYMIHTPRWDDFTPSSFPCPAFRGVSLQLFPFHAVPETTLSCHMPSDGIFLKKKKKYIFY